MSYDRIAVGLYIEEHLDQLCYELVNGEVSDDPTPCVDALAEMVLGRSLTMAEITSRWDEVRGQIGMAAVAALAGRYRL